MNVCAADMQILERVSSEGRGYINICMKTYLYNVCMYALRKCIHMSVCIHTNIMYECMCRGYADLREGWFGRKRWKCGRWVGSGGCGCSSTGGWVYTLNINYVYLCMYACIHACMHVCMHICIQI